MYKLYFFILCLIVCTACGKNYKIEGVSSDLSVDGKMLFIKVPVGNEWINVDSAEVIHGLFKMKGRIDSTMMAFLYMDDKCIMPFVFETGNIDINIINIENAIFSVKGTTLNERFNTFLKKQFSLNERANEIERSEARMILNGENPQKAHEEVQKRRTGLSKEIDNAIKTFIQDNYENILGPWTFINVIYGLPYPIFTPSIKEIIDKAPDSFKNNPTIKEFIAEAHKNEDKLQASQP